MFWEMLCPPKVRLASPQLATASCCFSLVLSRQRASQSAQAGMQVLGATRARLHPACPRSALALSPPCIACLCPAPQLQDYEPPSGALLQAIEADFGSLDKLVCKFNTAAVGVQVCVCMRVRRLAACLAPGGSGNTGSACCCSHLRSLAPPL